MNIPSSKGTAIINHFFRFFNYFFEIFEFLSSIRGMFQFCNIQYTNVKFFLHFHSSICYYNIMKKQCQYLSFSGQFCVLWSVQSVHFRVRFQCFFAVFSLPERKFSVNFHCFRVVFSGFFSGDALPFGFSIRSLKNTLSPGKLSRYV